MSKSNRGRAPRDRKRPYRFPRPPCTPRFPRPPDPVRPDGSECLTGPDPREILRRLRKRR